MHLAKVETQNQKGVIFGPRCINDWDLDKLNLGLELVSPALG